MNYFLTVNRLSKFPQLAVFSRLSLFSIFSTSLLLTAIPTTVLASPPRIDRTVECDMLIVGGGLAGAAAAYEGLLAGRTVCFTEITDWVGGQISSQGTSALDERTTQREQRFFPRGYLQFRDRILKYYDKPNPGGCWVSTSCFLPGDGHKVLTEILTEAIQKGGGTLHWFPNTVIKDLTINKQGNFINSAVGIQHQPAPGAPPLNTEPLSQTIEDSFTYENSDRFTKTITLFIFLTPFLHLFTQNHSEVGAETCCFIQLFIVKFYWLTF